jgi:hypothetical protein
MERDDWCSDFSDEIRKLRPHLPYKLAWTLALHHYDAKAHPREAARQYDKAQRGEPPEAPAKKRSSGTRLAAIPPWKAPLRWHLNILAGGARWWGRPELGRQRSVRSAWPPTCPGNARARLRVL